MENKTFEERKLNESQTLITNIHKQIRMLNDKLETILIDFPEKTESKEISGSPLIKDLTLIRNNLENLLNRIVL